VSEGFDHWLIITLDRYFLFTSSSAVRSDPRLLAHAASLRQTS
jgi:hypothetical protein